MATTTPTRATADLTITGSAPTAQDAQLMVQLAQLGQSMHVDLGQSLLWKHHGDGGLTNEQFEATYPSGTPESIAILNVLKWYETIGTLVKQGLLDRGLILDWLWVSGIWDLCSSIAMAHRESTGSDAMWENFEALAKSQTD